MSKKRDQIEHRRQVSKARKGSGRPIAKRMAAPPQKEEKSSPLDIWIAVGIVVLVVGALVALWYFAVYKPEQKLSSPTVIVETPVTTPDSTPTILSWSEPPAMSIDPSKSYEAVIKMDKGDIRIQLFADLAPKTVNNFVFLARQGFYDGVTWHRVISGFMAQTGDPTGTGGGGPGYAFEDEFSPELRHNSEGVVSMANSGANTNGSQFFITYAAQSHLDDVHSVFGKVIEGMDVLRSITPRDPDTDTFEGDKIITIEIIEQ